MTLKAPFPYFGGKSKAAAAVWSALGDVEHYVEPFAGSLAVLLNRPHPANRTYHSETVNDLDALIVNAWRAIRAHPRETAFHASQPVFEADMHARHVALVQWRNDGAPERLAGDIEWCDPRMAGWWLWGVACWIGSGWCHGSNGPWWPDEAGRLARRTRTAPDEPGVARKLPHLSDDGMGVNHAGMREPGVERKRPQLSDNGRGVNHAGMREPGVERKRPFLSSGGRGVNRPQLREPGVDDTFGDVMPNLERWIAQLSARLRHVRVLNGTWENALHAYGPDGDPGSRRNPIRRALTPGASKPLTVRHGGVCGVFLDPPYADTADRADDLYAVDSLTVAHDVRAWCLDNGDDPDYRIVLAGFDGEHGGELEANGWHPVEWFTEGWLQGGMGRTGDDREHQQERERLWLSPHCRRPEMVGQIGMFDDEGWEG